MPTVHTASAITDVEVSHEVISPDGDGIDDQVFILESATGQNLQSWDGRDINGDVVPPGQYRLLVESRNTVNGDVHTAKAFVSVEALSPDLIQSFIVAPNPASDKVEFRISLRSPGITSLRIYTLAGELVWIDRVEGLQNISVWDLRTASGKNIAQGVYIVMIITEIDGLIETRIERVAVVN